MNADQFNNVVDRWRAPSNAVVVSTGDSAETLAEFFNVAQTSSGYVVSDQTAMSIATVYRCVGIIGGTLALRYGIGGPNLTVVTACASGANAIGEALQEVRDGTCDVMLAGGSEAAIDPVVVSSFANLGTLTAASGPLYAIIHAEKTSDDSPLAFKARIRVRTMEQ